MCDADLEAADVWREAWHRARKAYWCCACGDAIDAGHQYHRCTWIADGQVGGYVHCARCWLMYEAIEAESPNGGRESISPLLDCGDLWQDTIGDIPDAVAELAFALPGEIGHVSHREWLVALGTGRPLP